MGLVQALSLGERSAIPPDQWEVLTRTGTNHLVAISGLHVGLVAGFAFLVTRRLWTWSPRLTLALAAPRAATVAALGAALGYSALAGFSISTQRSLIMLAVLLGALYWGRTARPFAALILALGLVLALDPQALLSYGFWLSFGAVAALLYTLSSRPLAWASTRPAGEGTAPGGAWSQAGLPDLDALGGASVGRGAGTLAGAAPALRAGLAHRSSGQPGGGPAVHRPAPRCSCWPCCLSLIPGLGLPLLWMGQVLTWCLHGLDALAGLPWAAVDGRRAADLGLGGGLRRGGHAAGAAWPAGPLPWAGGLSCPWSWSGRQSRRPGEAWFTLLDVGQGLAAVVRTHRHLPSSTTPGRGLPAVSRRAAPWSCPFCNRQGSGASIP